MAVGGPIGSAAPALCRDCFARIPAGRRCVDCGSPRLLSHPELFGLTIAHLDCDAFFAAVEKRDDPSLANKPVIVGGGRRGVVSTACYIARTYGIGSAMPMFKALAACPDAVVIKPDFARYKAAGGQIRAMMEALTPAVEPLSLDEAFLDLTGTERLHRLSAAEVLVRLAKQVERTVRITVSIGLSHNKFLAKIASDLKKPRGFAVIGRAETLDFLAAQPIALIWGVGKAMQSKLERDGLTRIGQLQQMDEADLLRRYGSMGSRLYRLSRGLDSRAVCADAPAKSHSSETTFSEDIADYERLEPVLWRQCEKVSAALKRKDLAGWTVTLKLKTARHKILTRSRQLSAPTQLSNVLFETGRALLKPETRAALPYRLLGIGASGLVGAAAADAPDLIEPGRSRRAAAERAMDRLRAKYGDAAVIKGRSLPR